MGPTAHSYRGTVAFVLIFLTLFQYFLIHIHTEMIMQHFMSCHKGKWLWHESTADRVLLPPVIQSFEVQGEKRRENKM